jgi:putative transcriptional regulator
MSKPNEEIMRNRIGEFIAREGYKKKYVAEKIGVSQNQLSNWLTRRSYPSIPNLFRLADLFGVKVDDLFIRDENKD